MQRHAGLFLLITCMGSTSWAQNDLPDQRKWFVPDFVVSQYAGSIGFLSVGAGYDVFKNKAKLDLLVGYIPAFTGSLPLETATLKLTMQILKKALNRHLTITPLTTGTYFCYTPGLEFSSDLPSWYPDGYYWWSEAIRVNLFLGGDIKFTAARWKSGRWISCYYEIGTNEIKLVSYVQNGNALNIWTILHVGVGVRYHFN